MRSNGQAFQTNAGMFYYGDRRAKGRLANNHYSRQGLTMKNFRLFIAFTLVCFALSPAAQAVVPAPDGGYPRQNTAEGQSALLHLTTGTYNTAVGWSSLGFLTTGSLNTGIGAAALLSNTVGINNTANGAFALFSNTTGFENTATGKQALLSNTTGGDNTATGNQGAPFQHHRRGQHGQRR